MTDKILLTESSVSLALAIIFGVMGTVSLKFSRSFRRLGPTLAVAFFYSVSFISMTFALKHIEVGIAYGIWSGVGTILMMLIGVFLFNEKFSPHKLFFLILIVIGIIGTQMGNGLGFFNS